MSDLSIKGLSKRFGRTTVLEGVDLDVRSGELLVVLGPSGCGKSTLLAILAGLEEADSGSVRLGARVLDDLPARRRDVAMMFQSYALYPHMTVRENISFGLRMRRFPKAEIAARVAEVSDVLSIVHLLDRKPRQLSGGERQRVAMGRALARRPEIFLLDEPLSNLDAQLRTQIRTEIKRLHRQLETTMVFVTHDQVEAMTLADRIAIINCGRVEQVGTPDEIYRTPATSFVAQFLGNPSMNVTPARVDDGAARLGPSVRVACTAEPADYLLGFRPEHVRLGAGPGLAARGVTTVLEPTGTDLFALIQCDGFSLRARFTSGAVGLDERVDFHIAPSDLHLFHASTTERLSVAFGA